MGYYSRHLFCDVKKSIFVLRLRGTASKRNTGSTTLFYSLSLTFLIKSLISLSIHNIFDDEMPLMASEFHLCLKAAKYLVQDDHHIRDF